MSNFFITKLFTVEAARELGGPHPHAAFARLAAQCPVHHAPDQTPVLTRMSDINMLNKRRDVLGPGAKGPTMGGRRPLVPLDIDGAEHTKFRRLLDPLFSAKRMAQLEPAVRALADQLIDNFIARKEADLQAEFCQPLPSIFFLRLMGLPATDLEYFLSFKNAILGHLPPTLTFAERMAAVRTASQQCYDYLTRVLDDREARGAHGDDLLGWLVAAEVDGERLSREVILDISYLLILAGLDTVAASLASMIARLAREPALRRRLVADPELWASGIEELLRFESPVQFGFRTPTVDIEIGGEVIKAGTTVYLCWSSANLDASALADPLAIDLARRPNPHVAFGSGFHRCLGAQLARMELRAALEQLHRRIPDYAIKDGEELVFTGMPRAPNLLPLVWA